MPSHIGIVGCSAEGASLCYRTICVEGAQLLGPHAHPEVSKHTPSLAEYMGCIDCDDWKGVGELRLSMRLRCPPSEGAPGGGRGNQDELPIEMRQRIMVYAPQRSPGIDFLVPSGK